MLTLNSKKSKTDEIQSSLDQLFICLFHSKHLKHCFVPKPLGIPFIQDSGAPWHLRFALYVNCEFVIKNKKNESKNKNALPFFPPLTSAPHTISRNQWSLYMV